MPNSLENKDQLEIERKWILGRIPNMYKANHALDIVQLYGKDLAGPFRLRIQCGEDHPTQYFLTRKVYVSPGINHETETIIEMAEFDERLKDCTTQISKIRYVYLHNGLKFEVDEYKRLSLITMEVELQSLEQEIDIPDFILDCIITEATGNEDFSNYNLSKLLGEHKYKRFDNV